MKEGCTPNPSILIFLQALAHSHLFHFFCSDVKKLYIDKVCFYFLFFFLFLPRFILNKGAAE